MSALSIRAKVIAVIAFMLIAMSGMGQTETASSHVLSAAQSLSGDSNRLKLEVARFLESVRAA